jgi:DNA-directed RNA polymerase subunit RPC12/RpoP
MNTKLVYICSTCGLCSDHTTASAGCRSCDSRLFRVAYKNRPLIEDPLNDPYRRKSTEEDGYKLNTPFDDGEIGTSGLGSGRNSGDIYHEPGDAYDRNMTGSDNSDAFFPENSPLRAVNQHEPRHVGPHNMPHETPKPYNRLRGGDLFERVRKRRTIR